MGLATGIQSGKFLNGRLDGIGALTTSVSPTSAASIKKGLSDHSQVHFYMYSWLEVQVSNLRPLQCECSALPLS